jgi:hypothetical protein
MKKKPRIAVGFWQGKLTGLCGMDMFPLKEVPI